MAEYIERKKALEAMNCLSGNCDHRFYDEALTDAISELIALPSADVVEVVRCKDCKNWGGVIFGNVCSRWSAPLAGMKNCTKPDDYCSYGERRSDDES